MILGIKEDFTTNVILEDTDLLATPTSGIYLNSGSHPSITIGNLLAFLPKLDFTFNSWSDSVNYNVFSESKNRVDLVAHLGKFFECIQANTNQAPSSSGNEYWRLTDINSLRMRSFIDSVLDKVCSDLNLTRRIVDNQYLYENGESTVDLPGDYSGWTIEPRGSDYVSIRINGVSLQKDSATPVNLYIINEGTLLDTRTVTPSKQPGSFTEIGYTFSGKGRLTVAIDSTEVLTNNGFVDPLNYDGFVVYTTTGTGGSPEGAEYNVSSIGNGLGLNITASFDGAKYVEYNIREFGDFVRSVFELMTFQLFLHNSNNVSNRAQRIQMNDELLLAELKNTELDSVISRYYKNLKKAKARIEKSFDTSLSDNLDGLVVTLDSV